MVQHGCLKFFIMTAMRGHSTCSWDESFGLSPGETDIISGHSTTSVGTETWFGSKSASAGLGGFPKRWVRRARSSTDKHLSQGLVPGPPGRSTRRHKPQKSASCSLFCLVLDRACLKASKHRPRPQVEVPSSSAQLISAHLIPCAAGTLLPGI